MCENEILIVAQIERAADAEIIARTIAHFRASAIIGVPRIENIGGGWCVFASVPGGAENDPDAVGRLMEYGNGARDVLRAAAGGLEPAEQKQ